MKSKQALIATILFILFLSGCIPSIHSLYTDDDIEFRKELLGDWIDSDKNTWSFTSDNQENYILEYAEGNFLSEEDKLVKGYFITHLVKLDDYYFLDLYPDDNDQLEMPSLLINTLLPVHIFAKVEFGQSEMVVKFFNPDRMKELLEEGRIRINHEETDELFVLTASTRELQRFVLKYAEDEEAFIDELILKRN